jgi:monofunctional biosynthetic peptidoglycan transglycosylase
VRNISGWIFAVLLCFLVFSSLQVLLLRFMNPPFTMIRTFGWITDRGPSGAGRSARTWRALGDISPNLRRAVLAGEDQRFLWHHGFDVVEISHAIEGIIRKRGRRGASTITMQVARTVFLWPARTWSRKAVEAYYTFLLEMFLNKKRIFEIYLNTVDWGAGIRGAEAASRRYFNTSSANLSPRQAALLAAVLPGPHKWSVRRPNAEVRQRELRILRDMKRMPLVGAP